jgi:hypothetical protein
MLLIGIHLPNDCTHRNNLCGLMGIVMRLKLT